MASMARASSARTQPSASAKCSRSASEHAPAGPNFPDTTSARSSTASRKDSARDFFVFVFVFVFVIAGSSPRSPRSSKHPSPYTAPTPDATSSIAH